MTFGERLKELRQDNDETQEQIGKLLNIGARMISHYEKDEHFPREAKSILRIAEHFNVTTDYLFGISTIKNAQEQDALLTGYESLNEENKKTVLDFIEFLSKKQHCKKRDSK